MVAGYNQIFVPQGAYGDDGTLIAPVTGRDYESGSKGEFHRSGLNAALSRFRSNNVGRAADDASAPAPCMSAPEPCLADDGSGYCKIANGQSRSEGWDGDVAGDITPDWHVIAGDTNTRTETLASA